MTPVAKRVQIHGHLVVAVDVFARRQMASNLARIVAADERRVEMLAVVREVGDGALSGRIAVGGLALAPFGIAGAGARLLDLHNLGLGLVVAILSSAIPFSLEFAALRRLSSQVFGILMSLEPAMGAAAGFFFLGQRLSIRDLLAIALVSVASAGATLSSRHV